MLVKLWAQFLVAFRPPAPPAPPTPVDLSAPPQATANPDLELDCPDEAFEVLRRVAKAADERKDFVVLKKGRVPPHQRHLVTALELKRAPHLSEPAPPAE